MLMAALPGTGGISFNYVDGIVAAWLIFGIFRGRKRGMTQELLPTIEMIAIVVVAGLFYVSLSPIIFNNTGGAFSHLWSNVTAYVIIAFALHLLFLWLKQNLGEKLTGSDSFGSAEYYLGMGAGFVRYSCIFIIFVALIHARVYTAAELAETAKMQKKNFEDISFPTFGSVQHAILSESFTGRALVNYMPRFLITTGPPTAPAGAKPQSIAKKREETINMIIGAPPPQKK